MVRVRIEFLGEGWEFEDEIRRLLYEVLYRGFGVEWRGEWLQEAPGSVLAVALTDHGEMLGAARLLPGQGDERRQVRQVAVVPQARTQGVGRALMEAVEARATSEGATEVWLNARDNAFAFYVRMGYEFTSDVFVSELTGIPHRSMRKGVARERG